MLGILRRLIRKSGAWAHQRHIAEKDVDKLWQFVEGPAPQMHSHRRHAGIPAQLEENTVRVVANEQVHPALLTVAHHRAKFVNPEPAAALADPDLCKKRRTTIGEPDGRRQDDK